jgi:hypothetical protein
MKLEVDLFDLFLLALAWAATVGYFNTNPHRYEARSSEEVYRKKYHLYLQDFAFAVVAGVCSAIIALRVLSYYHQLVPTLMLMVIPTIAFFAAAVDTPHIIKTRKEYYEFLDQQKERDAANAVVFEQSPLSSDHDSTQM